AGGLAGLRVFGATLAETSQQAGRAVASGQGEVHAAAEVRVEAEGVELGVHDSAQAGLKGALGGGLGRSAAPADAELRALASAADPGGRSGPGPGDTDGRESAPPDSEGAGLFAPLRGV